MSYLGSNINWKVSIITINYNNAVGLRKTIESILRQSYRNIEYIIIDGGSNDSSIDIINKNLENIHYWISEADKGIYHAMNKGIRVSTGNYLLFINSGDTLVAPDVIESLIKDEYGAVDLIYGDLKRNFPNGLNDSVKMPDFVDAEFLMNYTLCHPVTLIHKRLFDVYGLYDERLHIVADWAFFLKVLLIGNATQKHKDILVADFAMDGLSSLPSNFHRIEEEREWVKETYFSTAFKTLYLDYLNYKSFYQSSWEQKFRKFIHLFKRG